MRWLLLGALVGCTTTEPSSPCSDNPQVLFVHGSTVQTMTVALDGTATLQLQCNVFDDPAFDLPSIATTSADSAVSVEKRGATLMMHADHAGSSTVAVTSPDGSSMYGSLSLEVAPVDHLGFRATYDDIPPNVDVAFAAEFGTLADVMLAGSDGTALVDDDMTVVLPTGAVAQGSGPGAFDYGAVALGSDTIAVDSGGSTYTTPFVVVDHADSIALVDPAVTVPADGSPKDIAFAATLGGRFVASLRWSYDLEGSGGGANVDTVSAAEDVNHDGAVSISASAGGASTTTSIPVH